MWVPAWENMAGGIRCLRLYEVSEIPCKSMAVFWHFFYCPGKGIPDNKKYFVGYHTLYGMEPKWYCSFFVRSNEPSAMLAAAFGDCRIGYSGLSQIGGERLGGLRSGHGAGIVDIALCHSAGDIVGKVAAFL